MKHADVPSVVARVLGRPTRWAPPGSMLGNYDGHERTLQVFNVESKDQLRCLELLESHLPSLEQASGGALVVIFFSAKQSTRHSDFVMTFETPE